MRLLLVSIVVPIRMAIVTEKLRVNDKHFAKCEIIKTGSEML